MKISNVYKAIVTGFIMLTIVLFVSIAGTISKLSSLEFLNDNILKAVIIISAICLMVMILISVICSASIRKIKKCKKVVEAETEVFYYGHFAVLTYLLMVAFCTKSVYLTMLVFIAEFILICIHIIIRVGIILYRFNMNKVPLSIEEFRLLKTSFLWQYKVWNSPRVKVNKKNRKVDIMPIITSIVSIIAIITIVINLKNKNLDILSIIVLIYFRKAYLNIIDFKFNLFTLIEGKCTNMEVFKTGKKGNNYYVITITDFERKREIKLKTKIEPSFRIYADVVVIHGILSKNVVKLNGREVKCDVI